jgi:hypothetical protein
VSEQMADGVVTDRSAVVTDRGDPAGNERLTAITGTALLVLFAAEVVTTLLMGSLFGRYYLGSRPYVRRGPPPMPQRIMGPILVLTSAGVLGSGVMLAVTGPDLAWQKLHCCWPGRSLAA